MLWAVPAGKSNRIPPSLPLSHLHSPVLRNPPHPHAPNPVSPPVLSSLRLRAPPFLPSCSIHPIPALPNNPPPSLTTPQGGLGRPGREEQSLLRSQPQCTWNPGVAAIRTARPAKAGREAAGGSGRARRQGRGLPCPLARFRVCLAVTAAEARLAADRPGSAAPRG